MRAYGILEVVSESIAERVLTVDESIELFVDDLIERIWCDEIEVASDHYLRPWVPR